MESYYNYYFVISSSYVLEVFPYQYIQIYLFLQTVVQLLSHVQFFATPWSAALHARLLCPSISPRVCSNSCPLSQWCHPTISSSVAPSASCPQSVPPSGSFLMSQPFASGGQSIGASASASVLPMNIQSWFPLGLTDFISLLSQGLLRISSTTNSKTSILQRSAFFMVQLSHPYMTTGNTIILTIWIFISKVMSLLFNYAI